MIHPFISIIILLGFGKACRKTIQFFLFPSNTFVIVGSGYNSYHSIVHLWSLSTLSMTFPIFQTFNLD